MGTIPRRARRDGPPPSQLAWLRLTRPLGLVENTALIATPNPFVKEHLETKLRPLVIHALSKELGRPIQIAVTVDPSTVAPPEQPPGPPSSPLSVGSPGHGAAPPVPQPPSPPAAHGTPQHGTPQHGAPQPSPYSYQATAYPPTAYQSQPVTEPGLSQPLLGQQPSLGHQPLGHTIGNPPAPMHQDARPLTQEPPHQQSQIPQHGIHQGVPPIEPRASQPYQHDQPPRPASARLNSKYTFETFVIGSSNRFAHAAAVAVAEAPAKAYNPLFIYGDSGLGKTHLLHAIGHYAQTLYTGLKVRYVSSEEFTNEFINMIRDGKQDGFRRRYRDVDVLLVDDIQFLENKEGTQEEFFHTFNTLHNASKQIVISSDRAPKRLVTLEDRLRSRFEWGLLTDVQPPELETRIAILRKKAIQEGLNAPAGRARVHREPHLDEHPRA